MLIRPETNILGKKIFLVIYFSFLNNNVFGTISVSFSSTEYILLKLREMRLLKIHEIKVRECMLVNKGVCNTDKDKLY